MSDVFDGRPPEQPTKVIIVTEAAPGRALVERPYAADGWTLTELGPLLVNRDGEPVAIYQAHAWLNVREEGAEVPDAGPYFVQGKKLAIAMDALRDIRETYEDDERGPCGQGEAGRALDKIAELDQ